MQLDMYRRFEAIIIYCLLLIFVINRDRISRFVERSIKQISSQVNGYNHTETGFKLNEITNTLWNESILVPKFVNTKKYMIYTCDSAVCGGLGDRQKGIVAAYILALLTNRTFGIVHTVPTTLTNFLRPNKVNWTVDERLFRGLKQKHLRVIDNKNFLNNLPNMNFNSLHIFDILFFSGNLEYLPALRMHYLAPKLVPEIIALSNSDLYSIVLSLLFKLSDELQSRLDNFFKEDVKGRKLVCTHIRIGKNPTMPRDIRRRLTVDELSNVWTFLKSYNESKRYAIFVASDSKEVTDRAAEMFGSELVSIPGKIVHIDKMANKNDNDGLEKMFLEQTVLSKCDILVLTRSSFNRIAAYMRNSSVGLYCLMYGLVVPCRHDLLDHTYCNCKNVCI